MKPLPPRPHPTRRRALGSLGSLAGALALGGLAGSAPRRAHTAGEDYRALVVVWLDGGNDGHNTLVPTDTTAYDAYEAARPELAMPRGTLTALPSAVNGKRFGMHPSLAPLLPLYTQNRLAFLANVGALVRPVTAAAVRAGTAEVPAFLGQHVEQSLIVQGGLPFERESGWGGRALEALPAELRHAHAGIATWRNAPSSLVEGDANVATLMSSHHDTWMGWGDLRNNTSGVMPHLRRMLRWQADNAYVGEYQRSVARRLEHGAFNGAVYDGSSQPAGQFGGRDLNWQLPAVARALQYARQQGLKRQVFMVVQDGFDTHHSQSGNHWRSQDTLLASTAVALADFDAAVRAAGLDNNVVTLVMSEFGRTLASANENGSEHGWGNHWWALGGPVAGGTVLGSFPDLTLNGPDDADGAGTLVPTMASDQVAATLLRWLGLPESQWLSVLPNLANFTQRTVPLLRV